MTTTTSDNSPSRPASIDAATIERAPRTPLVDALLECLRAGFDPEQDPPRTSTAVPSGQLLLMPSATSSWVGTKLVTLAPENPGRGLPLIQGTYVLFDGLTLAPHSLLDGAALTTLRTAAVSLLALRLLASEPPRRAVVIGTGVQAAAHVDALLECTGVEHIDVVGRRPGAATPLLQAARDAGRTARELSPAEVNTVTGADVVVCATSSATPLFGADLLDERTTVLAIGSYQPTTTELEPALVGRSQVVVESIGSALREAGDVLIARDAGLMDIADLVTLAALATGDVAPDPTRPRIFKGTGMAWQDLVCAGAIAPQSCQRPTPSTAVTT
ncbi:ornithine cyclodeaminase [Quadrisphaera granulorum]|uniref:Ornithine cyclodeaminase n=1 Tax=Quadrisphaera granulorum TaxID=317664 RepID=A0A316A8V4_9ACTN|nr:ornithine cyclodeaminase [Quadrisphaera granulorum]PWJ53869.1 ornithine cyclodeaminase [Quadrisphaera granulorum]SZE96626.1 ornithine cyclodeaminase [Quadrisphaera granulorum]